MRVKIAIAISVALLASRAPCYRNQPSRRQQGLHFESNRNVATHLWACDQENTDPSCSSGDLGNVAGPDPTDHRGCGYRRRGGAADVLIHVCADERGSARAPHNELAKSPANKRSRSKRRW